MNKEIVSKPVQDLGIAAYVLMHQYQLAGRKEKTGSLKLLLA